MSEFKTYTLEQLCIVGSSKRVHLSDYVQQGIPFYRSKEVIEISSGKNISEQLFISSEKYFEIKSKFPVPQENDVLITAVGTIGEILVVKDPNFYFKDGNLIWLRNINFDIIDIDYLYYFFKSDLFQKTIKYNNIGAVQKALTIDFLKTVKITLPSLDNQRKLVSVLKSIDKKILLNNQINQELEAMAKTLYDYWFVQFDFPDQSGNPYKSSGGKMFYNQELKREIPEGWGVEKLSYFLTIKNGKDHKHLQDGKFAVYGSGGVMRTVADYLYSGESILFPRKGTLNNVMYVNEKFWTVDTMFYSEVNKNNSALYVFYSVKDIDFNKLNTGTGVPSMTSSILYDLNIIVPEENILEKFNTVVKQNYETIKLNSIQNQELTQLRDWLLPMLMNGQVKVE
ncbi:restriction endonuclease subunit S [Streptococcus cristatus]|uniref:restriction endonuclease subunit S n=1 Tax=Streptococcus cristatus TaxID=45634 RepID=UPI0011F141A6|nr:restriction endonuclease subunit S [Streptococcus cristatus]